MHREEARVGRFRRQLRRCHLAGREVEARDGNAFARALLAGVGADVDEDLTRFRGAAAEAAIGPGEGRRSVSGSGPA